MLAGDGFDIIYLSVSGDDGWTSIQYVLLLVGSKLGREDTSIWGIVIPYSGGLFDWLEIDVGGSTVYLFSV